MRRLDIFIIALWSGLLFGLTEGFILNISRSFPVLLAPYKTSARVLWIAPLVDIVLFLIAGLGLLIVFTVFKKWIQGKELLISFGLFLFLGIFAVINAPRIIHPISAIILSSGLALIAVRLIRGAEQRVLNSLRKRIYWIPLILVGLGLGVSAFGRIDEVRRFQQLSQAPKDATNVLIIVMDTVRYDRFNQQGDKSLTPNLDKITSMGARFENAWPTTSWTLPSHASLLTGLYPYEHGSDWPQLEMDEQSTTLGEVFTNIGYVTGSFSGNSAWVTPEYLGRGFLRFEVYRIQDELRRTSLGRIVSGLLWEFGFHPAGLGRKAPKSNQLFEEFLDDYPEHPFFVMVNYMDVNQAYYNAKFNHPFWEEDPSIQEMIDAYDDGLRVLDSQIGDLFSKLEQRGILENTLIIITSDHGESFGAHETDDHDPQGHGTSLYVEQLRVPLFIIYPDVISAGRSYQNLVSLRQIPVTIMNLLNLDNSDFPGKSIINNRDQIESLSEKNTAVVATLNYDERILQSMVWNNLQYIKKITNPIEEELYNLSLDPLEKRNLFQSKDSQFQFGKMLEELMLGGSINLSQDNNPD